MKTLKLWLRVAMVIALASVLAGALALQTESVSAAPPCSLCEALIEDCCGEGGGTFCSERCNARINNCFRFCIH